MARQVIILKQNLMGDWIDDEGNRYNDKDQRIDYLGRVIPEPWEEPTKPSLGNDGASFPEPKTLADFNNPYFFLHKRAELQEEIDRLERAHLLQKRNWSCNWNETPLQDAETQVPRENEAREELETISQPVEILEVTNLEDGASKVSEDYKGDVDEIERLLFAEEDEVPTQNRPLSIDTIVSVDRHVPKATVPASNSVIPEPQCAMILNEIATPGSYKRKSPDSGFQPPCKRLRVFTEAIVVIAVYLVDPRDAFVVYSKGPRPPPPKRRYVLSVFSTFCLSLSFAGKKSHPPRKYHPAAYTFDPALNDAVYHLGPRPP